MTTVDEIQMTQFIRLDIIESFYLSLDKQNNSAQTFVKQPNDKQIIVTKQMFYLMLEITRLSLTK